MPVDLITIAWDSGLQSNVDDKGKITQTATRVYDITVTDAVNDNEATVKAGLAAQQGVTENSFHPQFGTAFLCKSLSFKRETPIWYTATAQWRTPQFDSQNPGETLPWNQPAVVDYGEVSTEGEIDEDRNGDAIVTANNEPISGVMRSFDDMTIQIRKNFLGYSGSAYYTFKGKVNSDTYLGFPPGVLRLTGLSAQQQDHNGQIYYAVTGVITVRNPYRASEIGRAWWHRHLHQGWMVREEVGGDIVHAVDDLKLDVTQPVLLDEDGVQVPDGGTPHFLEWQIYDTIAFSAMGFF